MITMSKALKHVSHRPTFPKGNSSVVDTVEPQQKEEAKTLRPF